MDYKKNGERQFSVLKRDALGNIITVLSIADGIIYSLGNKYTIILKDFLGGDITVIYQFLKFFEDRKTVTIYTKNSQNDKLIFEETKTVEMKFLKMNNGARPLEERRKDA